MHGYKWLKQGGSGRTSTNPRMDRQPPPPPPPPGFDRVGSRCHCTFLRLISLCSEKSQIDPFVSNFYLFFNKRAFCMIKCTYWPEYTCRYVLNYIWDGDELSPKQLREETHETACYSIHAVGNANASHYDARGMMNRPFQSMHD
eukprot:COSAG05_NODE_127_length_17241_cov_7.514817_17_plen_144_part_00